MENDKDVDDAALFGEVEDANLPDHTGHINRLLYPKSKEDNKKMRKKTPKKRERDDERPDPTDSENSDDQDSDDDEQRREQEEQEEEKFTNKRKPKGIASGGVGSSKRLKKADGEKQSKQSAAEKRGEERKKMEAEKAIQKEQRKQLKDMEEQTFRHLPPNIRVRRTRAEREQMTEYIDVMRMKAMMTKLQRNIVDPSIQESKREEAKYLYGYLKEFEELLQTNGMMVIELSNKHTEGEAGRKVYVNKLNYYSRHGAGRRYTTIERKTMVKGIMVKCNKKYKQRGEDGSNRHGDKRSFSLQGCPKAIRAQLSGAFNHDVDMRLAHPTIAVQLRDQLLANETDEKAKKMLEEATLDIFNDYVENRDTPITGWIDTVCDHHEIEGTSEQKKECVKKLFCRIMFGGSYSKWRKSPYGQDKDKLPKNGALKKMVQLETELARLRPAVFASTTWKQFVAAERQWIIADAKLKNITMGSHQIERSIFSRLMQTIENDILQIMVETLRSMNWTTTTLIFDGCHILHRKDANLREALDVAQKAILQQTGFKIMLLEKPLFNLHKNEVELSRL